MILALIGAMITCLRFPNLTCLSNMKIIVGECQLHIHK